MEAAGAFVFGIIQLAVMWEPQRGQIELRVDAQTVPQLEHVVQPDAGDTVPHA